MCQFSVILTELQGSRDIMLEQTDKVSMIIQVSGVTIFTTGEGVGSLISKITRISFEPGEMRQIQARPETLLLE